MANANLTLLTTANTFGQWVTLTNNMANLYNQLLNGTFVGDNGNIVLPNGSIVLSGGGTRLSVTGNVTISQQITSGIIQNLGDITSQGNNAIFTSPNVLLQVANTVKTKNLIVNNNTTLINVSANGFIFFGGNVLGTSAGHLPVTNETAVISIANNMFISANGNVYTNGAITTANANAVHSLAGSLAVGTTLTVPSATINNIATGNLSLTGMLVAEDVVLDALGSYSIINGNAVFNNITVHGNQTVQGTIINSSSASQLRSNSVSDGDGSYQIYRGTVVGGNAALTFVHASNTWAATSNDANAALLSTILLASNVVDSFLSTSLSPATANAVNAAYSGAIANAKLTVSNNGIFVAQKAALNFISDTPALTYNVAANTTNTSLVDVHINYGGSANTVAAAGNVTSVINDNGATKGFQMFGVTNGAIGGFPVNNGNLLRAYVGGINELFMAWPTTSAANANIYFRSLTSANVGDGGNQWSPWQTVITDALFPGLIASVTTIATTANTTAAAAYGQANLAYGQANTAYGQANTATTNAGNAFGQANTATTIAGMAFGQANTALTDAALAFSQASTANTNAGLAFDQANTAYANGNTTAGLVTIANNLAMTVYAQANAAFGQANGAFGQANNAFGQANNAFNRANLAFTAANSSNLTAGTNLVKSGNTITTSSAMTISGQMSAGTFNATSDQRLKSNLVLIADTTNIVDGINPYRFTWNSDGSPSAGVLAQEVEQVFPEAVHTDENGMKSVNYNALVSVLFGEVKSLKKRVAELEDR